MKYAKSLCNSYSRSHLPYRWPCLSWSYLRYWVCWIAHRDIFIGVWVWPHCCWWSLLWYLCIYCIRWYIAYRLVGLFYFAFLKALIFKISNNSFREMGAHYYHLLLVCIFVWPLAYWWTLSFAQCFQWHFYHRTGCITHWRHRSHSYGHIVRLWCRQLSLSKYDLFHKTSVAKRCIKFRTKTAFDCGHADGQKETHCIGNA